MSGNQEWKGLELDAKRGDKLTVLYKKDSSGDKFDDCVYLRNFSAGEALVVTFHANNGTEDTATQKIFGGKGTLKANTFTCEGKIFAGWATSAGGAVVYEDGAAITTETDLELYAVWSDAYTVTLRNGDTDTTVLVPQNSAIGSRIPADPTKKGYTFEGWFNGEEKLTAETVISWGISTVLLVFAVTSIWPTVPWPAMVRETKLASNPVESGRINKPVPPCSHRAASVRNWRRQSSPNSSPSPVTIRFPGPRSCKRFPCPGSFHSLISRRQATCMVFGLCFQV